MNPSSRDELLRRISSGDLLLLGKAISPQRMYAQSPPVHKEIASAFLNRSLKLLNIIAPRGIAKALSLDSIVYGPDGSKTIGDIAIGDRVFDRYGNIQYVTHKSDVFRKEMYKITLADRREIKVSGDHNNVILRKKERGNRNLGTREAFYEEVVATTKDILSSGIHYKRTITKKQTQGREFKYWIPTALPVEYSEKQIPLDPYLVGLLLGDGSINKKTGYSRLHCHIDDFPFYQKKLSQYSFGSIWHDKRSNAITIGILGIGPVVKRFIGTNNCYSKKIPKVFFSASKEQRIELLRGLMDTDGSISNGNLSYVSVSKELAHGVAEIVRSLGGIARVTDSKTYFKVSIRINVNPFATTRKAEKFSPNAPDKIGILSIQRIEDCPSQCISVTGDTKTFLTDGYTVTHNTTLVTLYILYHLFVEKTTGRKFVVIVSKTQGHAKSILGTIKDIIDYSQGFRALFGYHGEQVSKQWRDDMIELDTGDGIATRGTRQPMRGINLKMQRPTLVIVDDPEDENNTKTKEAMEQNLFYLLQSIEPSVDARDGRVIVIGTPLHELCIVQKLSEMGTYRTLFFQNSIEKGIALWPEMKPLEWLIEKRDSLNDIGLVRSYYQEYECTLIPGGDQMFKPDYFQYYDPECHIEHDRENDAYFVNPKNGVRIPVNIYMGIDPASSIQQSADYSTIVPIAMDKDENIYVLDYFRRRVTPLELADNIEAYFHRYKPNLTTIESVGYQEMLRNYLRSRIFIPGLEIKENPRQSKSSRLEMLQPFFAQKKVWMKKEHRELAEELIMFPKGKHEDTLDGLYYAVKRARAASHGSDDGDTREALPEHLQVYVEYFEEEEKDSSIPTYYDPFE